MVEKLGNKAPVAFRPMEVLVYIALGCSYEQTAHFLGISIHTVRTYLRQVLDVSGHSKPAKRGGQ